MDNKITTEQKKALEQPLPEEAVKPHPTKSYLSSIKGIYVSERLNNVFGIGSWYMDAEIVDNSSKMVVLKCTFYLTTHNLKFTHFGGNDNTDKGDAYKGAMTDALTKIAAQHFNIGVEVFKGHQTGETNKNNNKPPEQPQKPWLNTNTKEWEEAVTSIKNGSSINKLLETYLISTQNKSKLMDIKPLITLKKDTQDYIKVVNALKDGYTISDIKKKYIFSEDIAKELEAINKIENIKN